MGKKGIFFGVAVMLFAVGWEVYDRPEYEPGTREYRLDLRVFGLRRSYLLHLPRGHDPAIPLPLVVVLHGGFGNAETMEKQSGFSELSDKERFLVAYPNGIGILGWLQHWNAGHCCGFAMKQGIDDVRFVSRVIDGISRQVQVDPARIYIVGYSNGGMLGYLYAAGNPDTVAAVAGIAATIGSRSSEYGPEMRIAPPRSPIPVIAFHGLKDETVPYGGGSLDGPYWYVSVRESMKFWIEANRCAPELAREELSDGRIIKFTWKGDEERRKVVLCTVRGWDHSLPTRHFSRELPEAHPLKGLHAPEIIWEFFNNHPRTTAPYPNGM